ncbi:tetratricopeptide repeat protein [Nonlabens dokdonensis]|nr:tetratricopeptide repeat protein [Nonlabens dokdonensis]
MILFLAIGSIAFAQKKEMRKIEKAISKENFVEAQNIFRSIDENSVEEKYAATYNFYKAANYMDLTGKNPANLDVLRKAEAAVAKAKEAGYSDPVLEPMLEKMMLDRKFAIVSENLKSGNLETAATLLEEMYEKYPENLGLLYDLSNIRYSLKDYDKALEYYTILLDKKYDGVLTTYKAVKTNGEEQVFVSEKLRDLSVQSGSHSNPTESKSSSLLGDIVLKTVWIYVNQDNKSKGLEVYKQSVASNPDDISLKLAKADIYLTLGMMDEYKEAIENMGDDIKDPNVFINLGIDALKNEKYDSAITYFKSGLKLDPDNYVALVNIANSYINKGNSKGNTAEDQKKLYLLAIDNFRKAHVIKPEVKDITKTLVNLYEFLDMKEQAAEMKAKL